MKHLDLKKSIISTDNSTNYALAINNGDDTHHLRAILIGVVRHEKVGRQIGDHREQFISFTCCQLNAVLHRWRQRH